MLCSHQAVEDRRQCCQGKRLSSEPGGLNGTGYWIRSRLVHKPECFQLADFMAWEPTPLYEVKSGVPGKVSLGRMHWEEVLMSWYENSLWSSHLPIEVVDVLYVPKKGGSFFRPQRKFRLVPDAVQVVLRHQREACQTLLSSKSSLALSSYANALTNSTMRIRSLSFINDDNT